MFKSTTMNKKLLATLFLALVPAFVAGCGDMNMSGGRTSGNDLNSRVSQIEQRLNNMDTSGSASSWNDQESMRNDMNVLRNQMADLNNRLDGSGRGGDLSAEVAVLKQRVDRLEAAMNQLQSQMGLNLEAMNTPINTPPPLGGGAAGGGAPMGATVNPGALNANPGYTPPPVNSGLGTPPPVDAGAAGSNPYGTVPPPVASGATNPDGTETVIINGVPQRLTVNPNAASTPPMEGNTAAAAAANAPIQYGGAESSDPATALYNSGNAAFNAHRYSDALKIFSDFTTNYPKHNLAGNAWFWKGESHYQLQKYDSAALAYQEVITKFPKNNKMAAAMLKQGMCFEKIGNRNAANARYKELIGKFPGSPEAKRAKTLIR